MISPAVNDDVIAPGKELQLGIPGMVVVEASVDLGEGVALAFLYIAELSTASLDLFNLSSHFYRPSPANVD
jgi:hypothetical protein